MNMRLRPTRRLIAAFAALTTICLAGCSGQSPATGATAPGPPATAAVSAVAEPTATGNTTLTSFDATPPRASWTKPALGEPTADPAYGTTVRRVTSAEGTRFNRNTYSRRQPESPDGTRFFSYHGEAEYRVYDRASGDLVGALPIHPDAEPQWHPTDSNVIRHILGPNSYVGDLRLYETNVETLETVVIADLAARIQETLPQALYMMDRAEGAPSANGNRSAWIVYDATDDVIGAVSYDLSSDTVLGVRAIEPNDPATGELDWISMSPTGDYVVAGYGDATMVMDADLTNDRRINDKGDHSDIALNANGTDSYVYIDFSNDRDAGWLVSVNLMTLDRIRLVDFYDDANTSIHISGKGYDRPGWVVVSTYSCKVPGAWSCRKVMLVNIDATNQVFDLAHTYNCGDDYWTETHAAVNRSFTRVYFNSDGGSCGIDAEVYELTLPPFGQ